MSGNSTTFSQGVVISSGWLNDLNNVIYNLLGDASGTAPTTAAQIKANLGISGGGGTSVTSFNTRTGAITLTFTDVTNALGYTPSPTASPTFTGVVTVPTASGGDNSNKAASTAWVNTAISGSVAGVSSFNTRTGAVTLTSGDVTTALTFTPAKSGAVTTSTLTQATGKMLGRSSASTGAIEEITVGSGLTLSGGTLSVTTGAGLPFINVKDAPYNAAGNGSTDDTSAIQSALNAINSAGGGELYFPVGTYKVTGALTVYNSTTITGASRSNNQYGSSTVDGTTIWSASTTANIFSVIGSYSSIRNLSLGYSTQASASSAIDVSGSVLSLDNIHIEYAFNGVYSHGGNFGVRMTKFDIRNCANTGIFLNNSLDFYADQFVIDAGNTSNGALGNIRIVNQCEAVNISNGDVLQGAYSMTTDGGAFSRGSCPAFIKFNGLYFDSSANGVLINNTIEADFIDCWFSNRPNHGMVLNVCDGIKITGGQAMNCGQSGIFISSSAKHVMISNFSARGNSASAGAGAYPGISVQANTTDFSIVGCMLGGGSGYSFGSQSYGVIVAAGTSDRYFVANNLASGNVSGTVFDGGTGVNKAVANNF